MVIEKITWVWIERMMMKQKVNWEITDLILLGKVMCVWSDGLSGNQLEYFNFR